MINKVTGINKAVKIPQMGTTVLNKKVASLPSRKKLLTMYVVIPTLRNNTFLFTLKSFVAFSTVVKNKIDKHAKIPIMPTVRNEKSTLSNRRVLGSRVSRSASIRELS